MWTYVLTDLTGKEIGEVRDAKSRRCSIGLNRAATASFSITPDSEFMPALFGGDTLLKVYEDKTLRFHGNVVSTELSGSAEGSSIQVNAANPAWRLARRLIGPSKGGTAYSGDKAKSARKMIQELNAGALPGDTEFNPHTGIKLLAESAYSAGSGDYVGGPYRPALSCINDLAHTLNGFDWYIAPIEGETVTTTNEAGSWETPLIGLFEASGDFGDDRDAVFEFGWGSRNVRSINYVRDLADLANKAHHIPDDVETESVIEKHDQASIEYRGRFEAVADAFGITDTALRTAWVEEFLRVKKNPRFVVGMTLDADDGTGRVPKLGEDYWLGDMVTARGTLNGVRLFNGGVRVYAVDIDIPDEGEETVTPILLDEEGESL